jgi:hypothetical protein
MDTLHVRYLYEPEGYSLGDGICYLPDFWLPNQDCFLEIKPKYPSEEENEKAKRLVKFTNKTVMICFGNIEVPSGDSMIALFPPDPMCDGQCGWDCQYYWCECPHCHRIDIQFNGRADRIDCHCPTSDHGDKGYNYDSPRLAKAYETAQGYRFFK